jgi:hypothetical protein
MTDQHQTIHDEFEAMGERLVESYLKKGAFSGTKIRHAQAWLELKAKERDKLRTAQEEEDKALRRREISASEAAADSAADAAASAREANSLARDANSIARDANAEARSARAEARIANSLASRALRNERISTTIAIVALIAATADQIMSLIKYISH